MILPACFWTCPETKVISKKPMLSLETDLKRDGCYCSNGHRFPGHIGDDNHLWRLLNDAVWVKSSCTRMKHVVNYTLPSNNFLDGAQRAYGFYGPFAAAGEERTCDPSSWGVECQEPDEIEIWLTHTESDVLYVSDPKIRCWSMRGKMFCQQSDQICFILADVILFT